MAKARRHSPLPSRTSSRTEPGRNGTMASPKEIRGKIKSVQSTRKITKAMEMVAASKMKKAQDRMRASRPYVGRMLALTRHLSLANPEYHHPFLVKRPGINTNALRLALAKSKAWQANGIGVKVTPIGGKGLGFMQRLGADVVSYVTNLGDRPSLDKVIGPVKVQLDLYFDGKIDELHLVSTRFENTMRQTPVETRILP